MWHTQKIVDSVLFRWLFAGGRTSTGNIQRVLGGIHSQQVSSDCFCRCNAIQINTVDGCLARHFLTFSLHSINGKSSDKYVQLRMSNYLHKGRKKCPTQGKTFCGFDVTGCRKVGPGLLHEISLILPLEKEAFVRC